MHNIDIRDTAFLILHEPIELGNAFAAQCFSNDEGSETHHGHTPIPVFCLCLPDAICKRLLPAHDIENWIIAETETYAAVKDKSSARLCSLAQLS